MAPRSRRSPRPSRGEPYLSRAEAASAWQWLRVFPRRAARLVAWLWRQERARVGVVLAATLVACLVLALLGTGRTEISSIVVTTALGALVLAVSRDHRTVGAVVVTVLGLSLVGTLAGPRWAPVAAEESMRPATASTVIGGAVATPPVGTYEVEQTTLEVPQPDGSVAKALLRRPVGAREPAPGVVFLHGAGTHTQAGFAEQAQALASAGAVTLVPDKPSAGDSLTSRDYVAMAAAYQRSVELLRRTTGVDPHRVGVYAESEGNYPGVVLAGTDPDLAFLVLASAPVVQMRQLATFAAGSYLSNVGVPAPLMTGAARLLGARTLPGGAFQYADFDPVPYMEQVTAPVLMLYGTADSSMPLVQGPQTVRDAIAHAGNTDLTVRYYEGANHGLKLGRSTSGALAPGVARDLSRWVMGLPGTAGAAPAVAGATPVQDFLAQAPGPTRWYASGDLMLGTLVAGLLLIVVAGVTWLVGQAPRLVGRPGLHLPDPVGRWTGGVALGVLASWVMYAAYVAGVAKLALSYSSNRWWSYGGWLLAQLTSLLTVVLAVKLVRRVWLVRGHARQAAGAGHGRRWLTLPAAGVLGCALAGAGVLLVALAYWGMFPLLV